MLALLTYLSSYLLLPKFLYRKKYLVFFTLYLSMIVVGGIIKLSIIIEIVYPGLNPFLNLKNRIYDNIIPLFLLVTSGTAARIIKDYMQAQKRLVEIDKEKAEAELKFLKSQVNPHFLFNSLNSIYFLIDKENAVARETLVQFADLLRYQLYDCNAPDIGIEKEVSFLRDYIRLQKIRKNPNLQLDIHFDENLKGFRIAPLLLIPFIENAFKHVSHHSDALNFITINLRKNGDSLFMKVNNSREAKTIQVEAVGGIGLNNVERRLKLLYPLRHQLKVAGSASEFEIELSIKIEKSQADDTLILEENRSSTFNQNEEVAVQ